MTEAHDPQRRRLLVGLAASPLLLLCGATSATSTPTTLTLTLTGQALFAHWGLCAGDRLEVRQ